VYELHEELLHEFDDPQDAEPLLVDDPDGMATQLGFSLYLRGCPVPQSENKSSRLGCMATHADTAAAGVIVRANGHAGPGRTCGAWRAGSRVG